MNETIREPPASGDIGGTVKTRNPREIEFQALTVTRNPTPAGRRKCRGAMNPSVGSQFKNDEV